MAFRSSVPVPKRSQWSLGDALVRGRGTGRLRAPNEARVESTIVATRFPTRTIPLRCSLSPVVGTWSSVATPRRYWTHSEPEGVLREAKDPNSWQTTPSAEEDTSEPSRLARHPLDGHTDSDLRSRSGNCPTTCPLRDRSQLHRPDHQQTPPCRQTLRCRRQAFPIEQPRYRLNPSACLCRAFVHDFRRRGSGTSTQPTG